VAGLVPIELILIRQRCTQVFVHRRQRMMRDHIRGERLAIVLVVARLAAFSTIRRTLWGLGTLAIGDVAGRRLGRGGRTLARPARLALQSIHLFGQLVDPGFQLINLLLLSPRPLFQLAPAQVLDPLDRTSHI